MIAFLNTSNHEKFRIDHEHFNKFMDNNGDKEFNWVWVDAECHPETVK